MTFRNQTECSLNDIHWEGRWWVKGGGTTCATPPLLPPTKSFEIVEGFSRYVIKDLSLALFVYYTLVLSSYPTKNVYFASSGTLKLLLPPPPDLFYCRVYV